MTNLDEWRAFPVVREFLKRNTSFHVNHMSHVNILQQWYKRKAKSVRVEANRGPYDLLARSRILTPWLALGARWVFACRGRIPANLFRWSLRVSDPDFRYLILGQAANARFLKPHDTWIAALKDKDPRCRFIAARILGYEQATESADALAGLDNRGTIDVRIQMAWSLAAMGDVRGRRELERGAEGWSDMRLMEWPSCFAYIAPMPWETPRMPSPIHPERIAPRRRSDIARSILAYVDNGGTIPLVISRWPRMGDTSLAGEPVSLDWLATPP